MSMQNKFKRKVKFLFVLFVFFVHALYGKEDVLKNLSYLESQDEYRSERCKLDIYIGKGDGVSKPGLIWFHGGGLKKGSKDKLDEVVQVAQHFAKEGVTFIAVNYRLSPRVQYPAYVEDATASIQWVIENAERYNINPKKIFVGGHSAGGYLSMMSTFSSSMTEKVGLNVANIAGVIPVSGQTVTHTTVKGETQSKGGVIVDDRAPMYHYTKMHRPILIIAADKDLKMRVAENQLLYDAIKRHANGANQMQVFSNRDHVSIMTKMSESEDPAFKACLKFIFKD